MTSGLLLVARSADAAAALGQALAARQVEKFYLALSDRSPRKKQGWVIGDMERSRRASWKLLPTRQDPAVTQFFRRQRVTAGACSCCVRAPGARTSCAWRSKAWAHRSGAIRSTIRKNPAVRCQTAAICTATESVSCWTAGCGAMSAPEAGACWPVLPEAWKQPALLPWPGGSVPGLQVEYAANDGLPRGSPFCLSG